KKPRLAIQGMPKEDVTKILAGYTNERCTLCHRTIRAMNSFFPANSKFDDAEMKKQLAGQCKKNNDIFNFNLIESCKELVQESARIFQAAVVAYDTYSGHHICVDLLKPNWCKPGTVYYEKKKEL
ncbi:hypothetical protein PFISCL1PPCAC_9701, partial [Pristionchus fissidentatus]